MIYILISSLIIIADQITKNIVRSKIDMFDKIEIVDNFFYITYVENSGAAWSIFENSTLFLIITSSLLLCLLVYIFIRYKVKMLRIILSIIIGGAIGNLIDRIFIGRVVDFFDFYIFSYDYPVFNIADISIVVGALLMAYYMLFIFKEES